MSKIPSRPTKGFEDILEAIESGTLLHAGFQSRFKGSDYLLTVKNLKNIVDNPHYTVSVDPLESLKKAEEILRIHRADGIASEADKKSAADLIQKFIKEQEKSL